MKNKKVNIEGKMREVRYIYTNDKGHEIYVIKGNDLKGKYGDEYPVKK